MAKVKKIKTVNNGKKKIIIGVFAIIVFACAIVWFLFYKNKTCQNCDLCSLVINCDCDKDKCDCEYIDEDGNLKKIQCHNYNKD